MSVIITEPVNNAEFQIGTIIEFKGTADNGVVLISLDTPFAGREFHLNSVPVSDGNWSVGCTFNTGGDRTIIAKGFDSDNNLVESTQLQIKLLSYSQLADIPSNINIGLSSARASNMIAILGRPGNLTENCSPVTNAHVRSLLVTENVGPFTVTGLKPAIEAIKRIFAKVKQEKPDLYQQLGTAGMLCCRKVRGGTNFSNHSWGTAVDIKISSELDSVGDGKAQQGLVELAPYFQEESFFWGAGFSNRAREDSMHFEASTELIDKWKQDGLLD